MAIDIPQTLVENLREQIMEHPTVQEMVNNYAQECVDHFLKTAGTLDSTVRDELFCQYQIQMLNQVFWAVGRGQ